MILVGPFNSRGFQQFSYKQGCTISLGTFHQLDGLDHQLKWDVGGRAFHGINFHEGVWVPVELYIREALIVFFPGSLLGPANVSPRHNSTASLQTGLSPSTSRFSGLIWLARQKRSVLPGKGSLRTSCLAWDFSGKTACLARRLAF